MLLLHYSNIFGILYTCSEYWLNLSCLWGFPGDTSGKEPSCQRKRHKRCHFDPWVGKIPCRRAWQPTAVFWPEEFHGQRSLAGCSQSIGLQRVRHDWSDSMDRACTSCLSSSEEPASIVNLFVTGKPPHLFRPHIFTPKNKGILIYNRPSKSLGSTSVDSTNCRWKNIQKKFFRKFQRVRLELGKLQQLSI